jgi:MFS family permease
LPTEEKNTEPLSDDDRRYALLFGAPSFALALCLGVLSTYLPVLARRFTSSTAIIGLLVGGEGLIAVLLPIWVGRWSDKIETRFGRRIPFLLATAPIAALALAALPFAPALWIMAIEVFVFYVAYFTYFSPYRALYPDFISDQASGRAQGIQGVFTGAGLGVALVGGGFLLDLWRPLPYFLGSVVLLGATAIVTFGLSRNKSSRKSLSNIESSSPFSELTGLLRKQREIFFFVIGNALLTLGLSGLKSFVVLWLTEGLGKSMTFTAVAMIVVAVGTVVGALASGKLGDRYGAGRMLCLFLFVFGGGLAVGTFSTSVFVLGCAFPVIAICGGAAVALPYALLMQLAPAKKHGIVAGLFDASSGVGTLLGPALTGLSIDLLRPIFPSSHGYSAMWPVLSIAVLGSAAIMRYARVPSKKS